MYGMNGVYFVKKKHHMFKISGRKAPKRAYGSQREVSCHAAVSLILHPSEAWREFSTLKKQAKPEGKISQISHFISFPPLSFHFFFLPPPPPPPLLLVPPSAARLTAIVSKDFSSCAPSPRRSRSSCAAFSFGVNKICVVRKPPHQQREGGARILLVRAYPPPRRCQRFFSPVRLFSSPNGGQEQPTRWERLQA